MGSVHSRPSELQKATRADILKELNKLVIVSTGHVLGDTNISSQIDRVANDIHKWKTVSDQFPQKVHELQLHEERARNEMLQNFLRQIQQHAQTVPIGQPMYYRH